MGFRRFFRRTERDRELQDEIESYVQIGTDENIARGMPVDEASAAARRKFGNPTFVREEIYRMNTLALLDTLGRDIGYCVRMLRRNPLFTTVALITFAIGIGANTAVFSVVNSVLLKPLPYPRSEELVNITHSAPGAAGLPNAANGLRLSASMYFTYAEQNRSLQSMGVWFPFAATITGIAEPERVQTVLVSDGALQSLGVSPILGRWLSHEDQNPGGPAGVLLSYGYWQRRFGGDSREIGIRSALGAQPREIKAMFVRYALVLAGIGVAIGLGAAAGLTRLMKSLLFGISPLDPVTYAAVPVVLIAAAALASYLPARRAAGVDPVETLRAE
ncbi:MAG TPA: FtsX-like permease family protein [Bryobacteraceae bacterium]|nr:FtsX-like permease family protein [Bryobacteraceae bacterium]